MATAAGAEDILISAEDLALGYPGAAGAPVIEHVNLRVPRGAIVSLMASLAAFLLELLVSGHSMLRQIKMDRDQGG